MYLMLTVQILAANGSLSLWSNARLMAILLRNDDDDGYAARSPQPL
jgi:hypothetical protein